MEAGRSAQWIRPQIHLQPHRLQPQGDRHAGRGWGRATEKTSRVHCGTARELRQTLRRPERSRQHLHLARSHRAFGTKLVRFSPCRAQGCAHQPQPGRAFPGIPEHSHPPALRRQLASSARLSRHSASRGRQFRQHRLCNDQRLLDRPLPRHHAIHDRLRGGGLPSDSKSRLRRSRNIGYTTMSHENATNRLAQDLDNILARTEPLWKELRGERLLITGASGFFGCWLLGGFASANRRLDLHAHAVGLSRNPGLLAEKAPHLARNPAIVLHAADVRHGGFPNGTFSHGIHAATDARATLNNETPRVMFDTIVEGTRRTLQFAIASSVARFLLVSSGAVYGTQPPQLTHVGESF